MLSSAATHALESRNPATKCDQCRRWQHQASIGDEQHKHYLTIFSAEKNKKYQSCAFLQLALHIVPKGMK